MSLQILNTFKDGDCMDSVTCSRVCAHSTSLLPREMFSLTFKWNFLYFSSCHFHLSLDTTEDVLDTARWLHLLYFTSSNIYTHEQHFPELSLLRDEYVPQFLSYVRCSNTWPIIVALYWTGSSMSMSLLCWGAQHWHSSPGGSHSAGWRWRATSDLLALLVGEMKSNKCKSSSVWTHWILPH